MSPNQWPATVPFDPESDPIPPELAEYGERSASDLAPAIVLLVGDRAQATGWAQRVVVALATQWADQGHRVVLADLALDSPTLHEELGEANTDGIADIFQFGASVSSMTRVVPGRGLRFIPAGAYVPDPAEILKSAGWDHIVGQFAEDHSTLLAYLPASADGAAEFAGRIARIVVLATPEESGEITDHFSTVGSIELLVQPPPEGAPAEGEPTGEDVSTGEEAVVAEVEQAPEAEEPQPAPAAPEIPGGWEPRILMGGSELTEPPLIPRKSRRKGRPVSPVLLVVLLVTLLGGGGVILSDMGLLPEWLDLPGKLSPGKGSADGMNGSADGAAVEPDAGSADPEAVAEPVESPIPYSVAVEAHQDYATALQRIEQLSRVEPGVSFFLSPIPNQGVVYYRVLAGPVADTTAAWELMRQLVASKQKTDLDPWSIRPTVWAYNLGDFETEAAARQRMQELMEARIPSYLVEVEYTAGPSRYRIYAGAYEGPAPAEVMAELLREAGIEAPLIRRHGKPIR